MQDLKILALCVVAAVAYGIVHDNITARVCVEYFTVFHPDLFHTGSPMLLALGWGVVATWWMGAILGVPLALIARLGRWPKLDAGDLIRPLARLMIITGILSAAAGLAGYVLARRWGTGLVDAIEPIIPEPVRARFLADLFAHDAAYASGFVGGVVLWIWAARTRRKRARAASMDPS